MEMLCPECLSRLVGTDGRTARCAVHGEFEVLFARHAAGVPAAAPGQYPPQAAAPMTPTTTPDERQWWVRFGADDPEQGPYTLTEVRDWVRSGELSAAAFVGLKGQGPFRQVGEVVGAGAGSPGLIPLAPEAPAAVAVQPLAQPGVGARCAAHPAVDAVARCQTCGTPVCATCDFLIAGWMHLCPQCAAAPPKGLSSKRKGLLGWSYGLAIWTTLGLAVTVVLAAGADDADELKVIDVASGLLITIPSLVGTALGWAAFDRRLHNPASMWVAAVWNTLILAIIVLANIIGLAS